MEIAIWCCLLGVLLLSVSHLAFAGAPPPKLHNMRGASKFKVLNRAQMIKNAQTTLGMDLSKYNYCVAGNSGVGKSSLINGLRGLTNDHTDPRVARVCERECTRDPTPYVHPDQSHVVLWDLPGGNTLKQNAHNYFNRQVLYAFDCIIVVTASRFTELDLEIADLAVQWEVPVFFVRNKFNIDLENYMDRHPSLDIHTAARDLSADLQSDLREQLQNKSSRLKDRQVYFVDSKAMRPQTRLHRMDEGRLINDVAQTAFKRRQ